MGDLSQLASATLTSFLVLVLARAAWHKWQAFYETVGFAQGYRIVPRHLVPAIVRGLMGVEVITILTLLLPFTRPFGGIMAAVVFAGYGLLMATALLRGQTEIDCGCGGAPQIVSGLTLGRNTVLTVMAFSVGLLTVGPVGPAGAVTAITAGITLYAVYGVAEKLASHLPHIRQAG
ncbi:MauE/DoxX family redox-associated membrane protein [Celeribacter halophilus]|uniref:Methylamine utilization protein MauE n=1 Tax=Celeribacter halophilus TaxID=576117 RepID=A0AAW7XVE7_9RHOB|nr:MauE/DoxX family redox-associated membrane protein [Celeribacter halophilus]MDO6458396.1 MauE/DoxX family redox-associated membrane protein [Celeribacter halophilus]